MSCLLKSIPESWFTDPLKPWRGVHRTKSIECILHAEAWSSVREIIASTPPEDMSRRAYFPPMMFSCAHCGTGVKRNVYEMKKTEKRGKTDVYCSLRCSASHTNIKRGNIRPFCNVCNAKIPKGRRQGSDACREVAQERWKTAVAAKMPM